MKKYLFLASTIMLMVGCTNDSIVDNGPDVKTDMGSEAISFSSMFKGTTRADHYGADAASILNNKFIVGGFKGATGTSTVYTDGAITTPGVPSTGLVFDNYQVNWTANTAGTTLSNTSNWEYVGLTALAPSGIAGNDQSIKYWDYTADQYDFIAYSTGDATVITTGDPSDGDVLVSAISAANAGTTTGAYTLKGAAADLQKCYIADMVTAYKTGASMSPVQPKFQDEIQLKFRALASKVRVALYETIPGYSVKDVKFYTNASTYLNSTTAGDKVANATLFTTGGSADKDYFYTSGQYTVYFPTIGASNIGNSDYNKAHVIFAADATGKVTTKDFSTLNYTEKQYKEKTAGNIWLGRSAAQASFAGAAANNYYQIAMPNEDGTVLELRIDYTLESIDESGEVIHVYGATAFVPAIYAAWKSNYAYTYIFKISDNTNGWTNTANAAQNATDPAGLYPITFDAVVMEAQDYTQSTITTVATPSITTYQKGHVNTDEEYDASKGKIYVQVMTDGALATDLNTKGKLYEVAASNGLDKDGVVSEAEVMDALNIVSLDATPVPMNGWTLTEVTTGTALPTAIPGADGNNITVTANTAFEFTPTAGKVYAYVYTISTGTQKAVGIANTLTTAPADWSTTLYFTDKDCTTAAPSTFAPGVYYKKTYLDNQNAYGVKIIRVKSAS
ncbi:MAG: hypothetical protein IJ887_04985 [Prevotella sp.]|nr:hypothetical protein [Prevotella sp.]MBR3480002.1 hypothetical protein [Prevotella sp.]